MNNADREARIDLAAAHRLAVVHDLHEGVCNHFTLAPPGAVDRFLVNAHGLHWAEVTASNLLLVDENREVLEGDGEPETSAFCIHGRIHRARPDARCVLHTHMPYATAISMIEGGRLEPAHQTALHFHGRVAYDDSFNGLALDTEEGDRIAGVLGDRTVLFLANHGVIVVGPSVAEAYDDLYYLERACQSQVLAMSTGRPLNRVPPEVVARTAREYSNDVGFAELHFQALKRLLDRTQPDYAA